MTGRIVVELAPLGDRVQEFTDRCTLAGADEPDLTLGQLLSEVPAVGRRPFDADLLGIRVARLRVRVWQPAAGEPVHLPPGLTVERLGGATDGPAAGPEPSPSPRTEPAAEHAAEHIAEPATAHPEQLTEKAAVRVVHKPEIDRCAAYLDSGLSVLVRCEKLLVEHLAGEIAGRSGRSVQIVQAQPAGTGRQTIGLGGGQSGRRQEILAALQTAVREAKANTVVVVPHLDLLAGGNDTALNPEARELTDVVYERSDCVLLAFIDPSLAVPEVLANRFAVRIEFDILPRVVAGPGDTRIPVADALVTREEAAAFDGFRAQELYKHIAGFNAVRLRHALRFALHQHRHTHATFEDLVAELRVFKAATSSAFEVPNVEFTDIGGYDDVRHQIFRALRLLGKADDLPQKLRNELVPRGFIFHGPPGTGKTLFAKATANALNATIQVVSGPEVTDMYVGESERKVREIFAEARRNAPAVIVFDEFDSIASRRSGREDGGSRAGNAMVAQLLTELDGFRPEVPVLVIGTTNRLDIIDDALLRPSRFQPVHIDLPDLSARRAIAEVHSRHFEVPAGEAVLDRIALATAGMNGDEIRSVFRDARAGEVLGDPPGPVDARRLGELVGALRQAGQDRDVSRGQHGVRPAGQARVMLAIDTGRRAPATTTITVDPDADRDEGQGEATGA
ncbi:ATP-binding protein [Dactylosporangium siamense]|uniref:AAA+ ATPase domain-containing protein n=1 Tax=Dactylosporangium siamense TaxID=685454 RepID=A0A919PX57_9ACTN|nr:ATP-binding protein [Dactylosporangium siamense]GIG50000.1 hypothetical protein Dsi01nite_080410 [Dactylosporangium siamense]